MLRASEGSVSEPNSLCGTTPAEVLKHSFGSKSSRHCASVRPSWRAWDEPHAILVLTQPDHVLLPSNHLWCVASQDFCFCTHYAIYRNIFASMLKAKGGVHAAEPPFLNANPALMSMPHGVPRGRSNSTCPSRGSRGASSHASRPTGIGAFLSRACCRHCAPACSWQSRPAQPPRSGAHFLARMTT